MTTYELHPLADIIPEASPEDFAALVESIRAVGQIEPIRLWDGRVIDGRHRLRACEQLGIEPVLREVQSGEVDGGTDAGLLAFVLALNINRRHATTSQRAIAAAKAVTTGEGRPKTSSIDGVSRERAATLFNVGTATLDRARQLINEADARVVDLVARGVLSLNAALESHRQLAALAAEQEAQGMAPDFEALAKEIDRLKRTNAKLRATNKALEAAGADGNAQAAVYADELERTRAELAKAQARIEAADKGLTVSPPKVVFREDPEKDRLLREQREMIASLKKANAEAEHKAKYHAALLEKADAQVIDKSTRLAQVEAPDAYLTAYTSGIVDDFNRRTRGAIGAVQRSGVVPAPEMIHQVETARALLDELLDLCRDRGAHEGAAALPALEVLS
jgi:ParB-like chromosome segregation protein Spo0J